MALSQVKIARHQCHTCDKTKNSLKWNEHELVLKLTLTLWNSWSLSCIASSSDITWHCWFVCSLLSWHSVVSVASATQLTKCWCISNTLHPTSNPTAIAIETEQCLRQFCVYLPFSGTDSLLLCTVLNRQTWPNVCSQQEFNCKVPFIKLHDNFLCTSVTSLSIISTLLILQRLRDLTVIVVSVHSGGSRFWLQQSF